MGLFIFFVFAVCALVLIGLAGWMFSSSRKERRLWNQLQQTGAVAEGEITQHLIKGQWLQMLLALISLFSSSHAGGGTTQHAVVFKFEVPDGERKKVYSVERPIAALSNLKVGDKVTVHYLLTSPTVARLATEKSQGGSTQLVAVIVGLIGAVLLIAGVFAGLGSDRDERAREASRTAYILNLSATPDPGEKTATANAQATSAAADVKMLALIRADFGDKLPEWQKVTDMEPHRLDSEVKNFMWVDYGYCSPGEFYAMFWQRISDRITINNELHVYYEGYGYYKGAVPDTCYPKTYSQVWSRRQNADLGDGWFAIEGARLIKLN